MTDLSFGLSLHRSTDSLIVYDAHFTPADLGIVWPAATGRTGETMMTVRVDYHLRANVSRGHYHFGCSVFHNATQRYLHGIKPAAHLVVHEARTWSGIADLNVRPVRRPLVEHISNHGDDVDASSRRVM